MISIIVPIYNVELYLEECIKSIINQTYKDIEVILINDGSTDKSGIICDEYAKIDDRIVVSHKENGGVSSARNKGLDIAKGDYIAFVDPDDYIEPNMYEEMFGVIKIFDVDIVSCNYRQIDENNRNSIFFKLDKDELFKDKNKLIEAIFKYKNFDMIIFNKLYKSNIFKNIRFPIGVNLGEDLRILYPTIKYAKSFYCMKKVFYNKRIRKNSLTSNKKIEAYLNNVREHELFLKNVKNDKTLDYISCYNACSVNLYRHYKRLLDRIYTLPDREEYKKIENETRKNLINLYKNNNLSIKYKRQICLLKYNASLYEKYRRLSMFWKKLKK